MHKIIKDFIQTDKPLQDIVKQEKQESQPVEIAFYLVLQNLNREPQPEATYQKIDAALEKGHPDEEVFLLFLSFLMIFYGYKGMPLKSESIFRILNSFEVTKYQPEIQAFYYQCCAYYYINTLEFKKREEANLLSILKMPKNSPRYIGFLINTSQIVGVYGRLYDLPQEDLLILEKNVGKTYVSVTGSLFNAFFIVNLKLIDKYYHILKSKFKKDVRFKEHLFQSVIDFLNGDFDEKKSLDPVINTCISYYKALKNRNLETAKLLFSINEGVYPDGNFYCIFNFIKFHHAFVSGRYDIIEDIIKNPEKQMESYILDFFIVRYFLVKNNLDLARYYYARLLKNCEKYQAMGRLKFEMQFAFEISAFSFFELTQPLQAKISDVTNNTLAVALIAREKVSLGLNRIIGSSKAIVEIKKNIKKFANIQRPILIKGETGVGKEVVSRAIHEESELKDKPFLAINCGTLTDTLLQSELFGYEAGAFTGAVNARKGIFEIAENGTVFLDEFGEMSPKLQVSLLRVLENNEIRRVGSAKAQKIKCRIIAATNANIEELIQKKLFREDLYHRLKQFTITIPPLREHKEDLPELIDYFLNQKGIEQPQSLSKDLFLQFQTYHWPGNIRELKNEIDRIKVLCGYKPIIEEYDIKLDWVNNEIHPPLEVIPSHNISSDDSKDKSNSGNDLILVNKLSHADKREQKIIHLFQKYKKITRDQIVKTLEVSGPTITKDLQRLCTKGVIIKRMPTLSPQSHYFELK